MKKPALHIYLVEPENYARQVVAQWLQDRGHQLSLLTAPAELLPALAAQTAPVDLIVADLPPGQAESLSAELRRVHRRCPLVPVVLRVSSTLLPAAEALHCGVYGYLNKPFRPAELELMLARLAERQASHSLQEGDSGLYHRVGFAVLGRQLLKAARRTRTQMALLRADVNGADPAQTEQALGQLGRVVQTTFRDADTAGRVDGTDCGVLLLNAGAGQVEVALRRLQQNLARHNAQAPEGQQLRVRVGLAHFDPARPCSFEELVAQADDGINGDDGFPSP
jgi:PleD family two-component response regulator